MNQKEFILKPPVGKSLKSRNVLIFLFYVSLSECWFSLFIVLLSFFALSLALSSLFFLADLFDYCQFFSNSLLILRFSHFSDVFSRSFFCLSELFQFLLSIALDQHHKLNRCSARHCRNQQHNCNWYLASMKYFEVRPFGTMLSRDSFRFVSWFLQKNADISAKFLETHHVNKLAIVIVARMTNGTNFTIIATVSLITQFRFNVPFYFNLSRAVINEYPFFMRRAFANLSITHSHCHKSNAILISPFRSYCK